MSRSSLLPDFLNNETWNALMNATDAVFQDTVDSPIEGLSRIRETTIVSAEGQTRLDAGLLIDESHLSGFDKVTNVLSGNLLGFGLQNSDMVTADQYSRLVRNIATHWYSKGKTLAEFISFVFNSEVAIDQLWTQDYKNFYVPSEHPIGDTVFEGGEWFPTSHVRVSYDPTVLTSMSVQNLITLVYELGPYTLVVNNVATDSAIPLVEATDTDTHYPGFLGSHTVALGLMSVVEVTIDSDDPLL